MQTRKNFIPVSQPWLTKDELREIWQSMQSGWVTLGPKTHLFEEAFAKYTKAKFAIGTNSGAAALHLACAALSLKEGDEVILPTFTFAATINAVLLTKATPVLVDSDPDTFNISVTAINKAITKKTRAIIVVHYAGYPCDMGAISSLAKKHKLFIIEDAAHALGARYQGQMVGSIGDITCFSFHPIKNITTGDGGMITTNNPDFADIMTRKRLAGMNKEAWKRASKTGSWYYEITTLGYKYNMNDIQASMGIVQLKKLESFLKRREQIAKIYNRAFTKTVITLPQSGSKDVRHGRNLYPLLVPDRFDRNAIIEDLREKNIGTNVYFIPLHFQPYYKQLLNAKEGDFPVAENLYKRLINIPLFPKMTDSQVHYVAKMVNGVIEKNRVK